MFGLISEVDGYRVLFLVSYLLDFDANEQLLLDGEETLGAHAFLANQIVVDLSDVIKWRLDLEYLLVIHVYCAPAKISLLLWLWLLLRQLLEHDLLNADVIFDLGDPLCEGSPVSDHAGVKRGFTYSGIEVKGLNPGENVLLQQFGVDFILGLVLCR